MKKILLFGAGKSASVLIEYLIANALENNWYITVADHDDALIRQKTGQHDRASAVQIDITDNNLRPKLIEQSDLVISMMPPDLHYLVATDCLEYKKHLLTASYADDRIKAMSDDVNNAGIIFLCEMGLDPGIDHMSAMSLIHEIKGSGGKISSFQSHCGGLVAPESDDNPWHYKISWNPKNVVFAGKAGAEYLLKGKHVEESYESLFDERRNIRTGDEQIGYLSWYPNRNSLPYIDLYELKESDTFIRTTLRYRDFMLGWKNIISLQLTNEDVVYQSDDMSLADFFEAHFELHNLKTVLEKAFKLKEEVSHVALKALADDLNAPSEASLEIAAEAHDINKILHQLYFLGIDDHETIINKGMVSAADVLQFAMEKKLVLKPADKDMIVMQHEIEFQNTLGRFNTVSSLIVKGKDSIHTAMAKTVGLPLGIAAKLILNGTIDLKGVVLPVVQEIYRPVLKELADNGIVFSDVTTQLS